MKTQNFFSFFLYFSCLQVVVAQPRPTPIRTSNPSNKSALSTSLERQFRRDAARLALRLAMDRGDDPRYLPIAIGREQINNIYYLLTTIYHADETAKSIARCNVHTFPNPSIDNIIIIYKRNVDWAAPLRQGITETTNKTLNDLLDKYDLAIEKHVQWNESNDAITIRSKEPLNMAALAEKFNDVQGVVQVDLGVPKFGGNDIRLVRVQNGWELDFVLQIGGGAVGGNNAKQHGWKYRVSDAGQVNLVREWGEPIPTWMRCQTENNVIISAR
jgi:hypothetical protein